jgi:hypothetical protein
MRERPGLQTLEASFHLVQRHYEEAKTHDEKVQFAKVAKEIAEEYRRQIVEVKHLGHASNAHKNSERKTRRR